MILVTSANGFVGTALCHHLVTSGVGVRGTMRRLERFCGQIDSMEYTQIGEIGPASDWSKVLKGVGVVVHLAARVHVMGDKTADQLATFRTVNAEGTLSFARQAAEAGVRRFIYLSSVKVNGEQTLPNQLFTERDTPAPRNPYSVSKYEAEEGLCTLAQQTNMEVVIIRSPLVYGPGVRANFHALLRAVARGVPLPFGAIHNRRSLVALGNLVDLIITCRDHPAAANQIFLVSDGESLSTPELIRRMARALGGPARLIPVPPAVLMTGATLLGKREVAARLCGSLEVDITKSQKMLGWTPPVSVDEGLLRTAEHYLLSQR